MVLNEDRDHCQHHRWSRDSAIGNRHSILPVQPL